MIAEIDAALSSAQAMYEMAKAGMETEKHYELMQANADLNRKLLAIQAAHLASTGAGIPSPLDDNEEQAKG